MFHCCDNQNKYMQRKSRLFLAKKRIKLEKKSTVSLLFLHHVLKIDNDDGDVWCPATRPASGEASNQDGVQRQRHRRWMGQRAGPQMGH